MNLRKWLRGRPSPPIPAGTFAIVLILWAVTVLVTFCASHTSLVFPLREFFATSALAALSAWGFLFTGWRWMKLLKRRLTGRLDPLEETAYELGIGIATAIFLLMCLGFLGFYQKGWAIFLLAALVAGDPRPYLVDLRTRFGEIRGGRGLFFKLLIVLVGSLTFLESLAPATSQDAIVYHLAIPDLYIREGGIHYIPSSFYASFPQNVEMLFVLGLLVKGSALAKWYHWLFGLGAALAVAAMARRASGGKGGTIAAAIFMTIPTTALLATWAYVDLSVVFFEMLAVLAFQRWWRDEDRSWLAFSGLFAGLAAGCKYTGGTFAVVIVTVLAVRELLARRTFREVASLSFRFLVVTGIVASPWLVKNVLLTGNPLYPFLYSVLGGRDWDIEKATVLSQSLHEWGKGNGFLDLILLPLRLTFSSRFFSMENYDGMIGPAFLLGAPILFLGTYRFRRMRLPFLIAAGLSLVWVATTHQIRFLLPALAIVSALIGASLCLCFRKNHYRTAEILLGFALVFNVLVITTHFAAHNPIGVVFGFEGKHQYLEREVPGGDYPVFFYVERHLPQDARILFGACGSPGFLCRRDYQIDTFFENETLKEMLVRGKTSEGILDEFRRGGFTHFLFRWNLVFDPTERKSGIPLQDQLALADFLNKHATKEFDYNNTFLYRIDGLPASSAGPGKGNSLEKGDSHTAEREETP